jgi:exonuclease III
VLLTAEVVDSDIDLHMPYDQNFNYYNMDQFLNDDNIFQCFSDNSFSALNSNIRSLCANYDKLANILSAFSSSICLTEIKFKFNQVPISNIDIPGYHFVSQPSYSNAGEVGFYIKEAINYSVRDDLTISKSKFEALWIEIQNDSQRNMLCGIIYRHAGGSVDIFQNYLNKHYY